MKKILIIAAVLIFASSLAYAAGGKCCCGNQGSDNLTSAYGARLCSGLSNTLLGWTEIFFRPGKVAAEGGNPIVGFVRGLGNAVARTGGGVVEVVTFWTPGKPVVQLEDCPLCAYK